MLIFLRLLFAFLSIFSEKWQTNKQAWLVDPDEYRVSFSLFLLHLDIWCRALDSCISTICICDVITHCLIGWFYDCDCKRKKTHSHTHNDKVKIVHSHLQLFDWMTAKTSEKKAHRTCLHYEMQVISMSLAFFASFFLYERSHGIDCMALNTTISCESVFKSTSSWHCYLITLDCPVN